MSAPAIARVVLYVKDLQAVAAFYERLFKMKPLPGATNGWIELASPAGGCTIALHKDRTGNPWRLVFFKDVARYDELDCLHFGGRRRNKEIINLDSMLRKW